MYYLLSKYATRLKKSITESAFKEKIRLLRNNDNQGYAKEFYRAENDEIKELKELTKKILSHLKIMEQDYIISLNHHSKNQEFLLKIQSTQEEISKEIFGDTLDTEMPESLTEKVATEIRDFARDTTNQIIRDLSSRITDQAVLQEKISFEIAKLDDIIYVKYGYTNKEVIKSFEK